MGEEVPTGIKVVNPRSTTYEIVTNKLGTCASSTRTRLVCSSFAVGVSGWASHAGVLRWVPGRNSL
jgi:hypothetical protein